MSRRAPVHTNQVATRLPAAGTEATNDDESDHRQRQLVEGGETAIVLSVETGYFGTIYRVRVLGKEPRELEVARGDLLFERCPKLLAFL